MSNKLVNKQKENNTNSSQIHMLVTMITIAITCVFCGMLIIDSASIKKINVGEGYINRETYDLIKAYKDEESVQVDIEFYNINTSDSEYENLRVACNEYIDNENIEHEKVTVNTNIGINEDLHVDISQSSIIKGTLMESISNVLMDLTSNEEDTHEASNIMINTGNTNVSLHETGPIYFQDRLLLRYINYDGEMQVVASTLTTKEVEINNTETEHKGTAYVNDVITYGRSELDVAFNAKTLESASKPNKTVISGNMLTEEEYINDLTELFIHALKTDSVNLNQKFQKQALKYFTYDGYNTVIESKNRILLGENATVSVNIAEAGMSRSDLHMKDRVFIQLKIIDNDKVVLTNIVVKLNDKSKVFDIDIL